MRENLAAYSHSRRVKTKRGGSRWVTCWFRGLCGDLPPEITFAQSGSTSQLPVPNPAGSNVPCCWRAGIEATMKHRSIPLPWCALCLKRGVVGGAAQTAE